MSSKKTDNAPRRTKRQIYEDIVSNVKELGSFVGLPERDFLIGAVPVLSQIENFLSEMRGES